MGRSQRKLQIRRAKEVRIKELIIVSIVGMLLVVSSSAALAEEFSVKARSAILMEADTGQVLFAKGVDEEHPPASITKVMTTLLTMEAVENGEVSLDDKVEISDYAESMGGSQLWLGAGEVYTLRDLLKGIVIESGNDACVAVAEHVGGSESNFVRMMNKKAQQLGMEHTNFVNTTGLPVEGGGHYSSAQDIAIMSRELIKKYPIVLEWAQNRVDYIGQEERSIYTTNQLVGYYPGLDGLKTGHTDESGYCLSATAKKGDRRLISVVLGTENEDARDEETTKLLDYGFGVFHRAKLKNKGVEVATVPVQQGEQLEVAVETAAEFSATIKRGMKDEIEEKVNLNEELTAPIAKGEVVGKLAFNHPEMTIGEVELVTAEKVNKASWYVLLFRWLKNFVLNLF
jgi:D-alanyl-D-alanine carboxypeptidase (penicillin-binding protein 5/6)